MGIMSGSAPERPLQRYAGAVPPAPDWFNDAVATPPERLSVFHGGCEIEVLAWGRRGLPGLLLLHGNRAHAQWWTPIAAQLSDRFRVAAPSWPGMGGSGWRQIYREVDFAQDALAAAEAADLFAEGPPVFAAHSFGCGPLLAGLSDYGDRLAGGIIIDTLIEPDAAIPDIGQQASHRVYPSMQDALSRFRLAPAQTCRNDYYVDWVARNALRAEDGGVVWSFDPQLWERLERIDKWKAVALSRCPLAMIYGERSVAVRENDIAGLRAHAPALGEVEKITDAAHHLMLDQPLATRNAIARLATRLLATRGQHAQLAGSKATSS